MAEFLSSLDDEGSDADPLFEKMQTRGTARSVMLTRSIMLRLSTSSSLNVPERLPSLFQPKSRC